jgi:thiamine biosynthesis protein ThiS
MNESISIVINGERVSVPPGLNVRGLLRRQGVEGERVAVEMNRRIVPRPAWDSTTVEDGAVLEIVTFVGGG